MSSLPPWDPKENGWSWLPTSDLHPRPPQVSICIWFEWKIPLQPSTDECRLSNYIESTEINFYNPHGVSARVPGFPWGGCLIVASHLSWVISAVLENRSVWLCSYLSFRLGIFWLHSLIDTLKGSISHRFYWNKSLLTVVGRKTETMPSFGVCLVLFLFWFPCFSFLYSFSSSLLSFLSLHSPWLSLPSPIPSCCSSQFIHVN